MSRVSPVRRQWASVLASLLSPANPSGAIEGVMAVMPFFDDFPDAAFCRESAKAVALADRYGPVPSFDAAAKALRAWWRDHRPHPVALPAPQPQSDWREPTEAEKVAVALRWREAKATWAEGRVADEPVRVEPRHLSPNDLAAAYRHEAEHGADARLRECAAMRLAMIEGLPPGARGPGVTP